MIQIGDLYRGMENFDRAITAYNRAARSLGDTIPSDYWHLLYVRGMAYEQAGDWPRAEKDLKAALAYQPAHPYILNYLGYAWADQGIHLDEALTMIEKAMSLRPDDGYITDSMGWVLFKMNQFEEAVPFLEQAVALMPYDTTVNDHLGDAYWRVGRRLEARFQWERAKNHSTDADSIKALELKISEGLPELSYQGSIRHDFALDKTAPLPRSSNTAQ
jgi:tetratricopeptide (TPR) repeat protein